MPIQFIGSQFAIESTNTGFQFDTAVTALSDGRFAVAWTTTDLGTNDIRVRIFDANGNPSGNDILVDTVTSGIQETPSIAAAGTGFVVVWKTNQGPTQTDIKAQLFNSSGTPVGLETTYNTFTANNQQEPYVIGLTDGRYVVAFRSLEDTDTFNEDVRGRIFSSNGTPAGNDFVFNSSISGGQIEPSVAALPSGRFIAAWTTSGEGVSNGFDLRARIFNADGTPSANDFVVNTTRTAAQGELDQNQPNVTALDSGRFVVTWSTRIDSGNYNIRARLFNADGTGAGNDFVVNTSSVSSNIQFGSVVAGLADGRFVIAWTSNEGVGTEVRARVFNDDGVADGNDFIVSTAAGNQDHPAIATLPGGHFVVTWQDGSGNLFGQILALPNPPVITSNGGGSTAAISVAENSAAVTTVVASDADGPTPSYSIFGGADAAKFTINAGTGVLAFVSAPDAEQPDDTGFNNVYDVIVRATDSGGSFDTQTIAVTVTNINDVPPFIFSDGQGDTAALSVAENTTAVTTVTAIDDDSPSLTYSISGGADAATFAIDANTGVLTFVAAPNFEAPTDADTDNVYEVVVETSDGSLTDTQAISVTVTDVADNNAPVVTASGGTTAASEQIAIVVDAGLTVTDVDSANLSSATVTITGNFQSGQDVLAFTNQNGISGSYNSTTGVLTLNGSSSVANYQTALRSVTYTDTSDTPNTSNRTISFVVNDGTDMSTASTKTLSVAAVNDAPVVTASGSTTAASEQVAVAVDAGLTLSDVDSANLSSATVSITGNFQSGQDVLAFANQNGISGSYNSTTGVLTLTGSSSVANYQTALRSVTYIDTSDTPNTSNRTISVVVNDGSAPSTASTKTVSVAAVNDQPANTVGAAASGNEDSLIALTGISLSDPDADPASQNITVSLTVAHGTLDINTAIAGGVLSANVTGDLSSSITITATQNQINTTLAAANGLLYQGSLNFNGTDQLAVASYDSARVAASPATASTSANPGNLITADINGDGRLDLVYTGANQVMTRLGNGDGTFQAEVSRATGVNTLVEVIVADLTGDAIPDIAYADYVGSGFSTGNVRLLVGTGGGNFNAATSLVQLPAFNLIAMDFNNDGRTDIAVDRRDFGGISILLSTGPNTFAAPVAYSAQAGGTDLLSGSFVAGDFTGDGRPDIVVTNGGNRVTGAAPGTVTFLRNNGNGTFQAATNVATGQPLPSDSAAGDVNGDGLLDLAFTTLGTFKGLTVMLGNGDGTFQAGTQYATTASPTSVRIVDINGDGRLDLLATVQGTPGSATVFLGNGNGTFQSAVQLAAGTNPDTVAVGDFDGDGDRDLVVANVSSNNLSILLNTTSGPGDIDLKTINVAPVNDAPVVTASGGTTAASEQAAIAIDSGLTATDVDNTTLSSATVTITGNFQSGQDVLAFTNQNGISGSYNSGTGVLTLTGSSSVANYQTALRSVTYANTSDTPNTSNRTISFVVNDGSALSTAVTKTVSVAAVNDAPLVTASGGTTAASEQIAIAVDAGLTLSDVDSANLASATVSITGNFQSGQDVLAFGNQNGITGSYNSTTGVLTLNGSSSVANYQTALRSVTYTDTSDTPNTSNRTISFAVNDGTDPSTASTKTVSVAAVNDAPSVSAGETLNYTENQGAMAISPNAAVTDLDAANFNGGSLTVSLPPNGTSQDFLSIGIDSIVTINSGVVSVNGVAIGNVSGGPSGTPLVVTFNSDNATPAAVTTVMQHVEYSNVSSNPSVEPRTVTYTVIDGDGGTQTGSATATINITAVNNRPVVTVSGGTTTASEQVAIAVDNAVNVSDVDSTTLESATMSITGNFQSGQDVLAFVNQNGITGSYNSTTGVLTLSGSSSVANYLAALRSVTYTNTSDTPNTSDRTVSFVVNDGSALSTAVTKTVIVAAVNDAPTAIGLTQSLSIAEDGGPAVLFVSAPLVSDIDSTNVTATLTISDAAAGILIGAGTPVGAVYTINDTLAQVNAALAAVTFVSTLDFNGPLSVAVAVSDGANGPQGSNPSGTVSITVTAVNDAPVAADDGLSSVAEDSGQRTISFASLLGNDTNGPANESGQTLTITAVSNAIGGTVSISGTDVLFTPTANFNGTASFDYTVQDNGTTNGSADPKTDLGSVSFTVTAVNDAPVAADDLLSSVAEDSGQRTISFASLLGNDSKGPANESGQTLTITAVSNAVGGTVSISGTDVLFTPTANFNGTASFDYTVQDNGTTNGSADPKTDLGSVSFTVTPEQHPPRYDFNGDGTSDLFWRNNSSGHVGIWEMHNNVQTWHDLGGSGVDHRVLGVGDFNGDSTSDLFWRNDSSGHVGIWEIHDNVQTWHDLGGSGVDHKVVGVGYFNSDNVSDILWRNDSSGHVGIWEMHNNVQTWHDLGGSGVDHKVVGVGDFNGDKTSDIFWRNDSSGHVGIWEMHDNIPTWHDLGGSGVDHKVVGTGDFNGDGTSDILWRNDSNGHVGIWEMHNNVQTWHDLGGSGVDHKVVGTGDYNGDHTTDVFWRNDATGHTGIWEMHDNIPTWRDLGGSGVDHLIIA
jgi:hypothetical protein